LKLATKKSLLSSDFVHLHNHTQYSLLDGLTKIGPLMDFVQEQGMEAIAITDHGTLSGVIEFYKEAKSRGIKPIIGIETYVASRRYTDKDPTKDKSRYHLILLAMNQQGYQNLMRLSTIANLEGFYYYPRIDHELIEKYNDGIIVLSGCMGSELGDALKQGQYDQAKQIASWYKTVFGDRYYIEVQDHGHPDNPLNNEEQNMVNNMALKLANELNISAVLTCDAHYLKPEDRDAHEILLCVGTGSYLSDEKRMTLRDFPLYVEQPLEVIKRWGAKNPEVIKNTKIVADRCDLELDLGKILIPKFSVPKGETEKTFLHKLTYRGLAWRYGGQSEDRVAQMSIATAKKKLPSDIAKRVKYELDVVDKMGFNGYFLIIQDFINWGKSKGIVFGPGRGSAAGSLISYALKITEIDPIEYDLLFERFLNPDRISMPDIDIDIQDTRRNEVIRYCIEKYGSDRVANIVTFGRMFARNAVRDVARVLQVPYAEADKLAKMIPPPVQGRHIPLSKSLSDNQQLKHEYNSNQTSRNVLDNAVRLESTVRSHGVHAAGVVIAPDDIVKFVPLEMAQKGVITTQYPMGPVEDLGLLKMDFLGLSNLTIIKNTLRIVKKVYDKNLDINAISLNDKKTYELLQAGDTTGVFQLESAGMKKYLRELKPTKFEDIIAMVALYRPGPMQFLDSFIKRKHGKEKIDYLHPGLRSSLEGTYGILVYQEQFMQISKEWCGFTGGQADTLRKAVGKKKIDLMRKVRTEFVEGAVRFGGATKVQAEKFWKQLEEFANYCFNKSHAACYGLIAYQTAYLKAHYPPAFMAALMSSDYDNTDRLAIEISECKHMRIDVMPPDINESFAEFAVVPDSNKIRFGMTAIKNVGASAVENIIETRNKDGKFVSLEDFFQRINIRVVNRKVLESLIKAGAFDSFGERSNIYHNLDVLVAYSARVQKERENGQTDLFGDKTNNNRDTSLFELKLDKSTKSSSHYEQLLWERELLGLYLSRHPLEEHRAFLTEHTVPTSRLEAMPENETVKVGGAIQEIREVATRGGQKMAFVKIEDYFGDLELIIFPSVYKRTSDLWARDKVIIAKGKISTRDKNGNYIGGIKILLDEANEITPELIKTERDRIATTETVKKVKERKVSATTTGGNVNKKTPARIYIRLKKSDDYITLTDLHKIVNLYKGETEVVLVVGPEESKQIIKLPMRVNSEKVILEKFGDLVGKDNVKLS